MSQNWARTKEIFTLALERKPEERPALLLELCGGDTSLRAEVESLLASHDRADRLLEQFVASPWQRSADVSMIGKPVGDYRVLGELGRGGTSIVYLAERADQQFQKRVAIKMLRSAGESADIEQRFRAERQTLAELNHPNIVTLLDGGTTNEGFPYLVMDFVEGVAIDRYCDEHRLPIDDRLKLFRTVCEAVEYAHCCGVIHRDLKPGNILVTRDGFPRLLDFGIAKLLDPKRFALTTMVTLVGMRAMTPEYASPEQMRGQPMSAATDIYSLGVLLYVLLCGRHPYRTADYSLLELERVVCEQEPVRPSFAARRLEQLTADDDHAATSLAPQDVAALRRANPASLSRALRGDLDAVALKALSKEPRRRYRSAAEFADDISGYLSGQAVTARQFRAVYRSGKFLARHRESLAVALIILVVGGGFAAWQLQRSQATNFHRAPGEIPVTGRRSVAVVGFSNLTRRDDVAWLSTAFSEMLSTELAAGGELRVIPEDTVARAKIELSLTDETSYSASALRNVRQDLGSDYVISGSYLALGAAAGGRIRLDVRLQDAATVETVMNLSEQGNEQQLFEIVLRIGSRLRQQLGVPAARSAESASVQESLPSNTVAARLYTEGLVKLRAFDPLGARDSLVQAERNDPAFPLTHAALAKAWLALGYDANARPEAKTAMDTAGKLSREDSLLVTGRYYEAIKDWEQSIEAYRTLFDFFPDNPEYGLALANAQTAAGDGTGAVATLQRLRKVPREEDLDPRVDLALAQAASVVSDNTLQADIAASAARKAQLTGARLLVADARVLQCRALANLGRAAESTPACEEALTIYEATADWAGAGRALHNMAELPLNQGKLDVAQALYEQALAMARRTGDRRGIARELGNLGVLFNEQGRWAIAEQYAQSSLNGYREIGYALGVAGESENLADILHAQGRLQEALAQYQDSLAHAKQIGSADLQALDLAAVGDVLVDQGDLKGAAADYQQALDLQNRIGEKSYYAKTLVALGRLKALQGSADEARALYAQALSIQGGLGEKGNSARTQLALAELMCDEDQASEAVSLARTALREFQSEKQNGDEFHAQAVLARALLTGGLNRFARRSIDAAGPLAERASVIDRLELQLQDARVEAAEKNITAAEDTARAVLTAAETRGLVKLQLQASLTLDEIMTAGASDPVSRRSDLGGLEDVARSKGFELIARKAAALTAQPTSVWTAAP
jgi:serine/threonine protein kinase/tetratricopeptide (TPR) repeat protein/TolB-like protein